MTSPLEDLIAGLEFQLVQTLARLYDAQMSRRYVEVMEAEERIDRLHAALAIAAERLTAEGGQTLGGSGFL
jgi:hypothetical protein